MCVCVEGGGGVVAVGWKSGSKGGGKSMGERRLGSGIPKVGGTRRNRKQS